MSNLRSINPAIVVLLLLAAGLGFVAFSLASGKTKLDSTSAQAQPQTLDRPEPRPEPLLETGEQPTNSIAEFVGVTIALETIEVAASSEGRLEAVYVNLGDQLKPGDRIARINSDSINQSLAMARASLQAIQAEERRMQLALTEAEDKSSRRRTLAAEGLLSKEEVVSAELQVKMAATNLEAAKARIAEQQARVAQVADSLANTELRAPFAGTVAARLANAGQLVHSGSAVVSLIRADDLWIRFAVPQQQLASVSIGSIVGVNIEALNSATTAVVENIAPTVDAVSQLFFVEARLKIPTVWQGRIKPGLTVRCSLKR